MAAIKGQKTANEIASEFGIHVIQVNKWKKEAIDSLPEAFGSKKDRTIDGMEAERNVLFQQTSSRSRLAKKNTGDLR